MATRRIRDRVVRGSVKKALHGMHSDSRWNAIENLLNSFTALRNSDRKDMYITEQAGREKRLKFEDLGAGISRAKFEYLMQYEGYEIDEEYLMNQDEPNYLNKMGIGMEAIADLSANDRYREFEIRSVSIDENGEQFGLITTYIYDVDSGRSGFVDQPDYFSKGGRESANYVLGRKPDEIQTGTIISVKDPKKLNKLPEFIATIVARKITQGYNIYWRKTDYDEFIKVQAPTGFCSKHEEIIGWICDNLHPIFYKNITGSSGYPISREERSKAKELTCSVCEKKVKVYRVYADLHSTDKKGDVKVSILIKNIKLGELPNVKHMMKGYVGCDKLEPLINREGIRTDESSAVYQAYRDLILDYSKDQGFQVIPDVRDQDVTNIQKWEERAQEMFLKYYQKFPNDYLLPLNAVKQKSELTGEPTRPTKITRPQNHKRCPVGHHWNGKECVSNTQKPGTPGIPRRKQKPRKKKTPKLSEQYDESAIPRLKFGWKACGQENWFMVLDIQESKLNLNTSHEWTRKVLANASDDTKDLVLQIAIMNAIPENQGLNANSFLTRLGAILDC